MAAKPINLTNATAMLPGERKAALSLAALYMLRMLGLFLILPVFALYAEKFPDATPLLAGVAIGIYGLTQACLQIPFGVLSDRIGRKQVIMFGLLIFVLGSVVAALADSIAWVIIGRALQGAGAIAAAVLALAADLSREEQRTKVMAIIGVSIGFSFALALILGPILNVWIGVDGIFWLSAALGLGAMALVRFVVPQPVRSRVHRDAETMPHLLRQVLKNDQLLRLDGGIFILHMVLTATFVALPLVLRDQVGFPAARHWQLYLAALLGSLVLLIPLLALAERRQRLKYCFLAAIVVLGISELGFLYSRDVLLCGVALVLFFASFNFLEASLPSLIAKLAPADAKGTALGVYSTSQFCGAFAGGVIAGALHGGWGLASVFIFAGLALLLWLLFAASMPNPRQLSSYLLNIGMISEPEAQHLAKRLLQVPGVAEAVVIAAEGVAYLKVDKKRLDEAALQAVSLSLVSA